MSEKSDGIQFFKTTIIGGLLFLVPVGVLIIVLAKVVDLMLLVAEPLADLIPLDSVAGVALANIIAAVVMTPSSPNPWSGMVYIMASDRVQRLNLPITAYMENVERFGQGTNELLTAASSAPTKQNKMHKFRKTGTQDTLERLRSSRNIEEEDRCNLT